MHAGISATCRRTNVLSVFDKKASVISQTVSRGCGQKRLGDVGLKLPRFFEAIGFLFPIQGTRAGVQIQSRSFRSAETPFRATMGSEPRRSGFGDRGKDSVSGVPSRLMDESEYPPLSASSSKAIRNRSGKGKGRLSAEQDHAHAPSKPQQVTQGVPRITEETERQRDIDQNKQSGDSDGRKAGDGQGSETGKRLETGDLRGGWKNDRGHSYVSGKRQPLTQRGSEVGEATERQENLNQNRQSVDHDGHEPGDREGPEIGKERGTGERRSGWKNDQVHHTYVSSRSQQQISRVSGSPEGTERQRDFDQNRQSGDSDGREAGDGQGSETGKRLETGDLRGGWKNDRGHSYVSGKRQPLTQRGSEVGEATERQENLNQNRQSVDHDGHEPGDREGPEMGKGRGTGERRSGWKNDQVHHTYVSSRSQQQISRVSGSPEGTERQRNSNQNRQSVYSDRREAGDRQDATWENVDALGRTMCRILRHQAAELNLKMNSDGYVNVRDLLKLPMKTRSHRPLSSHNIDEVKQAVQQDEKQRFGIKEENGQLFIRANQGHTLQAVISEHLLKPIVSADEIPICVHGTYRKFLDQILEEGLKRMQRNHVHFATGVLGSDGVISGMRANVQVLIYLNVDKALADGMKFYISENKVILTEGFEGVVPPQYFKQVLPIAPRPRRA